MHRNLRLGSARRQALRQYHRAGAAGLPYERSRFDQLFLDWGLIEAFTDPTRVWPNRYRLTLRGRRVTEALCIPQRKET